MKLKVSPMTCLMKVIIMFSDNCLLILSNFYLHDRDRLLNFDLMFCPMMNELLKLQSLSDSISENFNNFFEKIILNITRFPLWNGLLPKSL